MRRSPKGARPSYPAVLTPCASPAADGEDVEYLSVAEAYHAASDSWRALPPMQTPRRDAATGFFGGRLYVVGGCNAGPGGTSSTKCAALASVEAFDAAAGAWAAAPPLGTPRHGHGVGVCPGVGLLAFGGSAAPGIMNNPAPEPTSELLRLAPTTTPAASASSAQTRPAPGGFGGRAAVRAGVRWEYAANLSTPRYGLLKGFGLSVGGRIYAVGGSTREAGRLNPSTAVESWACPAAPSASAISIGT